MPLFDFHIDEVAMQEHTMQFKLPVDDLKNYHLQEDVGLEFENEFYYVSKIGPVRDGTDKYVQVKANAIWYRLGERYWPDTLSIVGQSPKTGYGTIMEAMKDAGLGAGDGGWGFGQIGEDASLYSMDVTNQSFLAIWYEWARITGNEIRFNTRDRTIDLMPIIAGNASMSFRYRRNLQGITAVAIPPEVTRLYPQGRNGITISSVNSGFSYVENYSFYTNQGLSLSEAKLRYTKEYIVQDDTYVSPDLLFAWAQREIARLSQPKVTYTCKVVDLSTLTGVPESRIHVGDFAYVKDSELGLDLTTRVQSTQRYPYEPQKNTVNLTNDPLPLPASRVSNPSTGGSEEWELFNHLNQLQQVQITAGLNFIHRLTVEVPASGEWVTGFSGKFTVITGGTIRIQYENETTGDKYMPDQLIPVVDGEIVNQAVTWSQRIIGPGKHELTVKAEMVDGIGYAYVESEESQLWVLARGARVAAPAIPNTQLVFNPTGNIQTWIVPEGVRVARFTVRGAVGSKRTNGANGDDQVNTMSGGEYLGGAGAEIVCWASVTPGEVLSIIVAGSPGSNPANKSNSYPNGGNSTLAYSAGSGGSGGGASYVIRGVDHDWLTVDEAHLIAVAGGGGGCGGNDGTAIQIGIGGDAGWNGNPGRNGDSSGTDGVGAPGGTQTMGGNSPSSTQLGGETSFDGDFGFGGRSGGGAAGLGGAYGGAGGGGWYGGGQGGMASFTLGNAAAGGGGGGSSHVGIGSFDLEVGLYRRTEDMFGAGQIIIEWDAPLI